MGIFYVSFKDRISGDFQSAVYLGGTVAFGDEVGEFYHPLSPSSYRLCIDVYGVAAFLAVSKGQETGERKDGKRTDGDDLI